MFPAAGTSTSARRFKNGFKMFAELPHRLRRKTWRGCAAQRRPLPPQLVRLLHAFHEAGSNPFTLKKLYMFSQGKC